MNKNSKDLTFIHFIVLPFLTMCYIDDRLKIVTNGSRILSLHCYADEENEIKWETISDTLFRLFLQKKGNK